MADTDRLYLSETKALQKNSYFLNPLSLEPREGRFKECQHTEQIHEALVIIIGRACLPPCNKINSNSIFTQKIYVFSFDTLIFFLDYVSISFLQGYLIFHVILSAHPHI